MSDDQPQPEAAPEQSKQDLRKAPNWYKRGPDGKQLTKAQAEKLMPETIKAVLGTTTLAKATQPLTTEGKEYLSRAIKQDVDEWRKEFSGKLRAAASDLLQLTMEEMQDIPPAARAYTLAVLVDKAQVLEGKTALNGASVNVQINNYGGTSKEDLIRKLRGEDISLPVAQEDK